MVSSGCSVNGTPIWVLEISDRLGEREPEPSVKFVANIHGDESSGRQLLVALAEWLCASHESDPEARAVVEELHLFLLPSLNPDGFAEGRRNNARGIDLNRNFPDPIRDPGMERSGFEQPEVRAVMDWTLLMPGGFTASGALHEGELVVNYPWDGSASGQPVRNTTSDDATFRHLATAYARHNPPMRDSQVFAGGITNGAEWYPIHGGMQDWNYLAADRLELTLELSTQKSPPASQLPSLFRNNLRSMLGFARTAALGGVRGRVLGNASATGLESELESGALGSDAPVPLAAVDGAGASQELGMQDGNLIPLEADVKGFPGPAGGGGGA